VQKQNRSESQEFGSVAGAMVAQTMDSELGVDNQGFVGRGINGLSGQIG